MAEYHNFDELAEDTTFGFKGKKYVIPAITNEKALQLFQLGKDIKKVEDGKLKAVDSADLNVEKEDSEDQTKWQRDYICTAVNNEDGSPVTEEDVKKWPMKVCMRIVKLINECISGIQEDTPAEKKQ